MYDELVKGLREHSKRDNCNCDTCFAYDAEMRGYTTCSEELTEKAADAIEELSRRLDESIPKGDAEIIISEVAKPRWIPVPERLPSDFVSVQAHMTDAGNFPPVREAYVVNGHWFFPALKEFHPVDMWRRFDEPPKEEA